MVGENYWFVAGKCRETSEVFYGITTTTTRNANF
jgi:hypothetical protein